MTFFSLEFVLIFILFFALYWSFANQIKIQNFMILAFNYGLIFSFSPYFALIIFIYTILIYCFCEFFETKRARYIFFCSIVFAILHLCFFKYFDVIHDDFRAILLFFKLEFLAQNLDIAFPIGISFYTFSSITYLVGVYKKEHKSADFITLASYLSFFATLIAGPICKSSFMLPQFENKREFKDGDLIIVLIFLGVLKKVLIANYLNGYVNGVFVEPDKFSSLENLIAVYGYGIWLYCDFSGYVDLVTALALAIGFKLPLNFNAPYAALNLKDFWRRWHISLSNFIRDYIYIPLGGNKNGFVLTQINLLIAFGLSGIWHGVGVNFLIWGLLHGFGVLVLNLLLKFDLNLSQKFPLLSMFITFNFVCFTWIFFANSDFNDAILLLKSLFSSSVDFNLSQIFILFAMLLMFFIYPKILGLKELLVRLFSAVPLALKPVVIAFVFILIFANMPDGIPAFIYASF